MTSLRPLLATGQPICAPLVLNPMMAMMADKAGFDALYLGGGATGYAQTVLEPGVIVDLPMSNMTLSPSGHATLAITNLHVKADACGGDVTIRSYAYLRVSTANAHSSYATYGDPIKI